MKKIYLNLILLLLTVNLFAQQKPTKSQQDLQKSIQDLGNLFKKKNSPAAIPANGNPETVQDNSTPIQDKDLIFPQGILGAGENCSVILINGVLYGWGDNSYGQSGNGKTPSNFTPVQITTDNDWRSISVAEYHTLAIKTDGTLWSWGWGNSGELGTGVQNTRSEFPTRVGRDTDWMSVSTADGHTMAIKSNGSLWTWGSNADDRLGIGPTPNSRCDYPKQVGNDRNWSSAIAGDGYTLAIKKDGSLWAWGFNAAGDLGASTVYQVQQAPIRIGTDNDWVKLFASWRNYASFGIKKDGTLWAWGSNRGYQLGLGKLVKESSRPMQVGASGGWVSVANGGGSYTLGVKNDGSLWQWGSRSISGTYDISTPERIGVPGKWVAVSAGINHATAIMSNGSVWSWGGNYYGQLGVSSKVYAAAASANPVAIRAFPVPVITTKPKSVLASVMNEETRVLFKNTRSKLSVKDKNSIAKLLGFPLSRDRKQFILDKDGADYPFDILVYPTDLNKDGNEEIFLTYGNSYTSSLTGSNVLLFIKDAYGDWHQNLGFPGMTPDALKTGNAGYPDLLIGMPGQNLPVWRWNGKEYVLNRKISDAEVKKTKAANIEAVSKAYLAGAFKN